MSNHDVPFFVTHDTLALGFKNWLLDVRRYPDKYAESYGDLEDLEDLNEIDPDLYGQECASHLIKFMEEG